MENSLSFIKSYPFFKSLTVSRKTVKTGLDPRLPVEFDTLQSVGERIVWPSEHDEDQNVNVQEKPTEVRYVQKCT